MKLALAIALTACAATNEKVGRPIHPVAAIVVDAAVFSGGFIVGAGELNKPGPPVTEPRDTTVMWLGFGVAALAWLPYWFVKVTL